jgi:hypothetical protein
MRQSFAFAEKSLGSFAQRWILAKKENIMNFVLKYSKMWYNMNAWRTRAGGEA